MLGQQMLRLQPCLSASHGHSTAIPAPTFNGPGRPLPPPSDERPVVSW